jgi:hypothetical protein
VQVVGRDQCAAGVEGGAAARAGDGAAVRGEPKASCMIEGQAPTYWAVKYTVMGRYKNTCHVVSCRVVSNNLCAVQTETPWSGRSQRCCARLTAPTTLRARTASSMEFLACFGPVLPASASLPLPTSRRQRQRPPSALIQTPKHIRKLPRAPIAASN